MTRKGQLEKLPVLRGYHREAFSQRLSDIMDITDGYDGVLETAWQTRQPLEQLPLENELLNEVEARLSKEQAKQLDRLAENISNSGVGSVSIEAAHVYLHEDLEDPRLQQSLRTQAQIATALAARLQRRGINTHELLFVDDYNVPVDGGTSGFLDIDELLGLTESAGLRPETIIREAEMAKLGKQIISVMDGSQGLVSHTRVPEADVVQLSRRGYELYREQDDKVSCAMLDSALTLIKYSRLGDGLVNILPNYSPAQGMGYGSQQRKVRTIITEHTNTRVLPHFNVFTGDTLESDISVGAHTLFRKPRA